MPDAPSVDTSAGSSSPPPAPGGSSFRDVLKGELDRERTRQDAKTTQIGEISKDITKSHDAEKAALAGLPKSFNLTPEDYQKLFAPPQVKYNSPYEGFGALASQLAVLGSAFTKRPLINGLNAASATLNAMRAGDAEAAKAKFDEWKANRDLSLKIMEFQHTAYKDQFQAIREGSKENRDEARARLQLLTAQFHDPIMHDMIALGHMDMAENHFQQTYGRLKESFAEQSKKLDAQAQPTIDRLALLNKFKAAKTPEEREAVKQEIRDYDFAMTPSYAAAEERAKAPPTQSKGREAEIEAFVAGKDKEWLGLPENAGKTEVPYNVHSEHRNEAEAGMKSATSQARSGPAMATQAFLEENRKAGRTIQNGGLTADDVTDFNANYARKIATERVFGAGMEARMVTSMNTVANHLESLRKYADALKNGDLRLANALGNRIATETGKPAPTNFGMAREIAGDEISRAVVGGVGAMGDRDAIKQGLLTKNSPEELAGAIDTAQEFIGGRLSELRRQYARDDPKRIEVFNKEMLSPLALAHMGGPDAGNPPPAAPHAAADPTAPAWAKRAGPHVDAQGKPIFTDGKGWFYADHLPVPQ